MATIHEQVSQQFHRWERRLRGEHLWPQPVWLEPPFIPFEGYVFPTEYVDDGRKPTFLSSLFHSVWPRQPEPSSCELPSEPEPEPDEHRRDTLTELCLSFPRGSEFRKASVEPFFRTLTYCAEPISFELVASAQSIELQFVVEAADLELVRNQLRSHFRSCELRERHGFLEELWKLPSPNQTVFQFSLEKESMLLVRCGTDEPLRGLVAALSSLEETEAAVLQILFKPARFPWRESLLRSVTDLLKHPVFINAPELAKGAEEKVARPLFCATLRLAINAGSEARVFAITRALGSALSVYNVPGANALVPLSNEEYPISEHVEDLLKRQTRRCGMLLNSEELAALVQLPNSTFYAPKLFSNQLTRRAPEIVLDKSGVLLGINEHAGEAREVRLSADQRVRNTYIIGTPGTGKSTLLLQLIREDLKRGDGIAVIDPHGDLIDSVLGLIPESRISDCVYLDPSDERFSIGFNVLSAHSETEKNLLAADLVSVFERLSTSWGDQMGIVLKKAILAFLERPLPGTLVDLQRFLIEPAFRKEILETVTDPEVIYYWNKAFPLLSGTRSVGPILTRLETFLSSKSLRHMVCQRENRLDFSMLMNQRKIFLAKLSQGLIGKENSYLLGSLLMSKFQQAAMGRQAVREEERPYFWTYADEFHDFITPSMAEILSGARKYRVGMILAHQEIRQLDRVPEVASAVRSAYTRICFRVTDHDANALEGGFESYRAEDLQKLGTGEAICRVERSDFDFNIRIPPPTPVDLERAGARREEVLAASYRQYATKHSTGADESKTPIPAKEKAAENETTTDSRVSREDGADIPSLVPDHQALKERIANAAQGLGFRSEMEKCIPNSRDRIDVVLTRGEYSIAVELSFTTTKGHEVNNVRKCLHAGYIHIAVVCENEARLGRLQKVIRASLLAGELARVNFHTPDAFIEKLKDWRPPDAKGPEKRKIQLSTNLPPEERDKLQEKLLSELKKNLRGPGSQAPENGA